MRPEFRPSHEDVINLWNKGRTSKQIASVTGLARTTIDRILKINNLAPRKLAPGQEYIPSEEGWDKKRKNTHGSLID